MTTTASHRPIVEYHGSIADLDGTLWRVAESGARLTLRSAGGLKLCRVRHSSVKPVAVPPLTPKRADALRELARYNRTNDSRAFTWLAANGLAERDDDGRQRITHLGHEVAAAIPSWY